MPVHTNGFQAKDFSGTVSYVIQSSTMYHATCLVIKK